METYYTEYQFFLFTQLFKVISEPECEYDMLYTIVCDELQNYFVSEFNDDNEPEYECMEWYLRANADVISITIADHTTY
jgi:hypothetical protein